MNRLPRAVTPPRRAAAAFICTALLGGCSPHPTGQPARHTAGGLSGLRPVMTAAQARRALPLLPVRPPASLATYRRSAFGPRWPDVARTGCSEREDVLLRDAVPGSTTLHRRGSCRRQVLGGQWRDPYTGGTLTLTDLTTLTQAEAIQIDHLVPLAEAWRSGASSWTPFRRLLFANDEANLVAVSAAANTTKATTTRPAGSRSPPPAAPTRGCGSR